MIFSITNCASVFLEKLFFELLVEGGPLNEYTTAISLVEFATFMYKI